MNKTFFTMIMLVLMIPGLEPVSAGKPDKGEDRDWGNHADPYTFLFGNHIDTHIELKYVEEFVVNELAGGVASDESALLEGYFYVFDSGETLSIGDLTDIPRLKHCTKQEHYDQGCKAGWIVRAVPCFPEVNGCQAMYLYHYHDHPVWMICPAKDSSGNMRGERQCISQDGSYTHFHWVTEGTVTGMHEDTRYWPSDLNTDFSELFPSLPVPGVIDSPLEAALGRAIDVPDECNVNMASKHTAGSLCPGLFLQITALRPFGYKTWAFHHGAQDLVLQEYGADNKTHLNLLTSFPLQDVITDEFEEAINDAIETLPDFSGGHGGGGGGGGSH